MRRHVERGFQRAPGVSAKADAPGFATKRRWRIFLRYRWPITGSILKSASSQKFVGAIHRLCHAQPTTDPASVEA